MRWAVIAAALLAIPLLGVASCDPCFGPNGTCGPPPDPSRVGGPSWFLNASPAEREAYFTALCEERPVIREVIRGPMPEVVYASTASCVAMRLESDAHDACRWRGPATFGPNAVSTERAAELREACKAETLAQH